MTLEIKAIKKLKKQNWEIREHSLCFGGGFFVLFFQDEVSKKQNKTKNKWGTYLSEPNSNLCFPFRFLFCGAGQKSNPESNTSWASTALVGCPHSPPTILFICLHLWKGGAELKTINNSCFWQAAQSPKAERFSSFYFERFFFPLLFPYSKFYHLKKKKIFKIQTTELKI